MIEMWYLLLYKYRGAWEAYNMHTHVNTQQCPYVYTYMRKGIKPVNKILLDLDEIHIINISANCCLLCVFDYDKNVKE